MFAIMHWLVDNRSTVYLILGVLALGWLFGVWVYRQSSKKVSPVRAAVIGFMGLVVMFLLIAGVALLSLVVQTDQMQIEHAVREMAEGIRTNDTNRVFAHVSDEFSYNNLDKKAARGYLEKARSGGFVEDVTVWDFGAIEISQPKTGKPTAVITFKVKPKGQWGRGAEFFKCKATFVKDADGKWRLKALS